MSTINVFMNSMSYTGSDCVTVSDTGRYSMMVHDWEINGEISDQPAVKMMIDISQVLPGPDPSTMIQKGVR